MLEALLNRLGLSSTQVVSGVFAGSKVGGWLAKPRGEVAVAVNPATNAVLGRVAFGDERDAEKCIASAHEAWAKWAKTPAPVRGDVVRRLGDALRAKRDDLGMLLSLEMGKIRSEGVGEVQEFIDMCDLAAGMSRQLPGLVLPSERSDHLLLETWNPLGVVGIITAFNFPVAVLGWNAAVSLVCGNTQVVKGAETASLTTVATQRILVDVLERCGVDTAVATLCQGRGAGGPGETLARDDRVALVSFTGSTAAGRKVNASVGARFGRTILELGGNNAVAVMSDADLDLALRSVLFAAVGTCGQRCTSLRRLLVHTDVYDEFLTRLVKAYSEVKIGDPTSPTTLLGPLHTRRAVELYEHTIAEVVRQGGKVRYGGRRLVSGLGGALDQGNFVLPTIVEFGDNRSAPILQEERFVPVLYVLRVSSLDDAVAVNNSVRQGLTSALFTRDMRSTFKWIGPAGSDTGIVNVNTSCSGAEIGGAFGGNKDTGGGRESGSDAWKQYMRRATCTVNFGNALPLAQGIDFASS